MSKHGQMHKPPSLAQLFEAPDGFFGSFGWLCGYTADKGFLNNAVERFVHQTRIQRAHFGRILIALMLDPSNPQISPIDVPGVAHLPFKQPKHRPFRLLHAKVALLGYRATNNAAEWKLRLIVSTGNWTRATLEESLDLAWHVEINKEDLKTDTDSIRQARVDINAAWSTLTWLRNFFDTRLLTSLPVGREDTQSSHSYYEFEHMVSGIKNTRGVKPRFFDSRPRSLLRQLPEIVKAQTPSVARNYLGMGSGFFEASTESNEVPSVLNGIVEKLQNNSLLTQYPKVDVFVNPRGCQAVAKAVPAFKARGWRIREAHKPKYFGEGTVRTLHAKFILSANYRKNSNYCNSSWIYLGSGNLTSPGFIHKMSKGDGNLEAGVVFAPEALYWEPTNGIPLEKVVTNVLPVQWEREIETEEGVAPGGDFYAAESVYEAPPVACLIWVTEGDKGYLVVPDGDIESFEVLDSFGVACTRRENSKFAWVGERPRQVRVSWQSMDGEKQWAFVPVLDELGRVAATSLTAIGIDEVWWHLENFPMPPDEEDLPPEDDPDDPGKPERKPPAATSPKPAAYPIRKMMQLVENIAAKQTVVPQADWVVWCSRLEQSMLQAATSPAIETFNQLKLNPLSSFWEAPFRPTFAETCDSPEGKRYEDVLRRIEKKWGVADLKKIGGQS